MANTLTAVVPQILAQGLVLLREHAVISKLVNTNWGAEVAKKGDTITIPASSAITAVAVTPANTPPSVTGVVPTSTSITLDQWWEAPFNMTDKDMGNAMEGIVPMQVQEAVKAIGNKVSADVYALYKQVYGFAGTAGTAPFGSNMTDATTGRRLLNTQLAPMSPRYAIIDPDAEANALNLGIFNANPATAEKSVLLEGQIGRKLGFDWFMDQLVPTHTLGMAGTPLVDGAVSAGVTTIHLDGLTTKPSVGDVFTIAGNDQTYVVISASTLIGTDTDVVFAPALAADAGNDVAVTFKASHVANMMFHRDAFALAIRPLEAPGNGLGNLIMSASDPVTGLGMRLEVSREHKQTKWSFDVLYGVKCVRPELAVRLAG